MNDTKYLLTVLQEQRKSVKYFLREPYETNLMISNNASGINYFKVFYENGRRRTKLINRFPEEIYRLAHKAYLAEWLKRVDNNIELMEKAGRHWMPLDTADILAALPKNYDKLDPNLVINPRLAVSTRGPFPRGDVPPRELPLTTQMTPDEWTALPYCENLLFSGTKKHVTSSGLRARTKSEMLLLEFYDSAHIAFHYDETITLCGEYVSSDFIGLRGDGRFIIHEHSGLWEPDYKVRNRRKLELYAKAGFELGDNLIWTYDSQDGFINMQLARETIRDRFMLRDA